MKFTLTMSCDNAAFADGNGIEEVARILRDAADRIEAKPVDVGRLKDINGNRVGFWAFEEGEDGWAVPEADEETDRPMAQCSCGFDLVWADGRWQHTAAPYFWGGDHPANAPEPSGPARDYWDAEDGVTD